MSGHSEHRRLRVSIMGCDGCQRDFEGAAAEQEEGMKETETVDGVVEKESGPIGWVPDGRLLRVVVQDVATGERLLDTTGEARDYSWTRVRGWSGTSVELSIAFDEKEEGPKTP